MAQLLNFVFDVLIAVVAAAYAPGYEIPAGIITFGIFRILTVTFSKD